MKLSRRTKKVVLTAGIVFTLLITAGGYYGIHYLYDYAIARNEKSFMSAGEASGTNDKENSMEQWSFLKEKPITWTQTTEDGLRLKGTLLENPQQEKNKTKKVLVLVHGYTSNSRLLKQYAQLFYRHGYTLFLPDARGHGQSEGDYIGFGYPDRLDLISWVNQLIDYYHHQLDIGLWGISMGAAEVMMATGEQLPSEVKCVIEDCGYTSTKDQLTYQLNEMFHLPEFPIIPLASAYTEYKAGYNFYESSAVDALHRNHLPMLFIHGSHDTFVPTYMVHTLYKATQGPKKKAIFNGASHAKSYEVNPKRYEQLCVNFLNQYM